MLRKILPILILGATMLTGCAGGVVSDESDQAKADDVQAYHDYLAQVDTSVTGSMIVDDKRKYALKKVDLHCTVGAADVTSFEASCTDSVYDTDFLILAETLDITTLGVGQPVRIVGCVENPFENGDGTHSPTVKAEFITRSDDPQPLPLQAGNLHGVPECA